jgi:uncharacterized OB-fold protein
MPDVRPKPVAGLFDDELWRFVEREELRLQRCARCGHVRYIPGPVCPACLSEAFCWACVSGTGRIVSWCVFHRQYFPELPPPYTVVLVEIPEGPVLAGNILDCPVSDLYIGMPVHLCILPVTWSDGSNGRIFQWRRGELTSRFSG